MIKQGWSVNTGKMPVEGNLRVECVLKNGHFYENTAYNLEWRLEDVCGDIIYWKLADE